MTMPKVAIIDKYPSNTRYNQFFDFDFDLLHLSDVRKDKILKKDITLDLTLQEGYDFVILVGAEPAKFVAKITGITTSQGFLIEEKFLPLTNPAMAKIKPESLPAFTKAVDSINAYVKGEHAAIANVETYFIQDENVAIKYLTKLLASDFKYLAVDTETTSLYARDGYVLGISLSHKEKFGVYIDSDYITDTVQALLQKLFLAKTCVFHNAKFDIKMLEYHFDFVFDKVEDTMMIHYLLDESPGTHGLKPLSIKYTDLGDYDKELDEFRNNYCKNHKIKRADFTYDLIPAPILSTYAAIDTAATIELFNKFFPSIEGSEGLTNVYRNIMVPAMKFLCEMEENGVPFSRERLREAQVIFAARLHDLKTSFYSFDVVKHFEATTNKIFNPNSVIHLRTVFFDMLRLPVPDKRTDTGAISTDKEVLEELGKIHALPKAISEYKKMYKIKSTYLDKILLGLDSDDRLRTGFNLTTTTSGRLSSSGKLNMQQLPRDDKTVKRCIKAREGYEIVSQDLKTAEMYIAAVLSGDEKLRSVFVDGGDFHSSMAKIAFNINCPVEDIAEKHKELRQAAKAVTFGILFGSGAAKVGESIGKSTEEAQEIINEYFGNFPKLKKWLDLQKQLIKQHGELYSAFGRKRRLKNAFSSDRQVSGHAIRSGVNFQIQSVSSDLNLIAAFNTQLRIKQENLDVKIFALVHDSIIAEVKIEDKARYLQIMAEETQKDMGVSIPGSPVGLDVEIGEDYSFVKASAPVFDAENEFALLDE
jgi:DNA polymerase I-like protein with 3'-5' exonuclease and polymerase domains